MPRSLIVEIFGEATQFANELDKAAGKTRSLGKMAGVAGAAIAGGLAFGLEKSVEAATGAQAQTQALDQALHNAHITTTAFAGSLDEAEKQGRNFGFSNNEVREALTKLVTATGDSKKSVEDLATAEDLARFKHMSLQAASDTLTRAVSGSSRALKQLGIDVPQVTSHMDALRLSHMKTGTAAYFLAEAHAKAADKAATAAARMQELNDKLHGQAAAFSDTAAGGMAQFHSQLENLEETIGTALLPALQKVTTVLADAVGWLSQHSTVAKVLVGALGALAAVLLTVAAATKIEAAAQTILNFELSANPIGVIVLALAALAVGLVYAWNHSETFRSIVKGVFADIKVAGEWIVQTAESIWHAFEKVVSWARANWPLLVGILTGPIGLAVEQIVTHWHSIVSAASSALNSVVNFFKALPGRILSALGDVGSLLTDAGVSIIESLWNGLKSKWDDVKGWVGGLGGAIKSLKGPLAADSVLLYPEGLAIMGGLHKGMQDGTPPVLDHAKQTGTDLKYAMASAFSGMDHVASAAINEQMQKAMNISAPTLEQQMRKMLAETTKAAVAGWSLLGDISQIQNIQQTNDTNAKALQDYTDQFVDTQFAGKGYNVGMSAAEVYALQAPNVVVNVAGSVSTQQDLVTAVQAGLAQTQSRNVTTGIR